MYNTSTAYKTAADNSGRITKIDIDYGDVLISSENVLSYFKFLDELITDEKKSIIGAFPAAKINYTLIGNQTGYIFPSANRTISIITSLLVSGSYEDVPLGTFIVTNAPTDNVTDEISVDAMDSSILFDKDYALSVSWPMTVFEWTQAICTKVGIVLGSTSWLNSTISIPEVVVEGSYRDAIKIIAAAGGCFAHMGRDNKLYFRTLTTAARDFLEVFEYSQVENYGPVNSLVLTKDPTNDNVGILDQVSITANGKTEVQIDNNPILETDRETLITPLFAAISGMTFAIASIEYTGDPSVDLGDIVRFLDQNSALQNLTVLSIQFDHTGSWGGNLAAIAPSKTDIDTDYAGTYDKRIKRTEINVDKVKQEISLVVSSVKSVALDASNALDTANDASDAATTAQSRADLAVTNAATAQSAANTAQGTANTANSAAATANGLLADIASDSKLTAVEKQQVKIEWDAIVSEKVINDTQATAFSITTEKTNYGTSYSALSTYITPLLASLTTTSDIVGATFRATFKDYYDKRQLLLNAIASKGKTLADAAQGTANTAITNAATAQTQANLGVTNAALAQTKANQGVADALTAHNLADTAQTAANGAQTTANTAKAYTDNLALDSVITPDEKLTLKSAHDLIVTEGLGTITNLVANGNFQNTTYWNALFASESVSNNTLSVIGNGTGIAPRTTYTSLSTPVNNTKTYVKIKYRVTNALCVGLYSYLDGSTGGTDKMIGFKANPIQNTWYYHTVVLTPTDFTGVYQIKVFHEYSNVTNANNSIMEVQYVLVIDLTAAFGAGNEPTLAQMDTWMAKWPNSWFDGSSTIGKISAQALAFGVSDVAFDAAFIALNTYLYATLGVFTNMTTATTGIVRATWNANWENYYNARTDLLNAISAKAKTLADTAQIQADQGVTDAATAQASANDANDSIGLLETRVNAAELKITPTAITSTVTSSTTYTTDIASKEDSFYKQATEPFTNMITNGDFSNETTNWGASGASFTPITGGVKLIGNGSQNFFECSPSPNVIVVNANDKVYMYSELKPLDSPPSIMVRAYSSTEGQIYKSNPTANIVHVLSGVVCYPVAGNYLIAIRSTYANVSTANGKQLEVYKMLAINLTATFGAGNELTKAVMDLRIKQLWLDTTTNITKAFNGGGWSGAYSKGEIDTTFTSYGTLTDTAQAQADQGVADAAAAHNLADTAITNAATAQTQANTATTNAATANGLLADLASDNKLTAVEKQMVKKEWDGIVSEKALNDTQATTFGITTEKTAYGTSYTTLSTYISPLLTNLTTTSDIVGATLRTNFKDYYDKLTTLLNAIAAKAKTLADTAQGAVNTLTTRVSTAESSIIQNATNIASKVASTDYNGVTIASLINQTADTVKVNAEHIILEGIVTANDNFKVLLDGSIEAVNGKFTGEITATGGNIGRLSIIDDDLYYQSDLFAKQYDNSDLIRLRWIMAGVITATNYDLYVYDINSTGTITTTDLVQLRAILAGTQANPNKMIRSMVTIGKATGEITVSSVSTTGYVGPSSKMWGDKIVGNMANIETVSIKYLTLDGLEVYSDAGTLKVKAI